MRAYDIQPKDHVADFEVRERTITKTRLLQTVNDDREPIIVLEISFNDEHSQGWEIELSPEEWKAFAQQELV